MLYKKDDIISLLKEMGCIENGSSITYTKYSIYNYDIIVSKASNFGLNCFFDNSDGTAEMFKNYDNMYKYIYQKLCIREKRISKLLNSNI
jgi:hypothetical protein